jgi:DnaJ homologue, subfamily C, member 28, conserved domain
MRDLLAGIDQTIREAQQEGKFDDLPGKGKPLVLDTSPDAVVNGLLKEANVIPEWIDLGRQLERLRDESDRLLESYAAAHAAEQAALTGAGVAGSVPAGERRGPASEPVAARSTQRRRLGWRSLAALLTPAPFPPRLTEARREEAIAAFHRRWEAALARYASLLHEINLKQRRFNQIVPFTDRQRAPAPVAERLEAFVERFPRLAWAEDGTLRTVRGTVPRELLTPPEDREERLGKRDLRQAAAIHGMRQIGRRPPPIG